MSEASVLAILGLAEDDIERFRDADVATVPPTDEYGEPVAWAGTYLRVRTRTGGANRATYHNRILTHHPWFEWTEDDEYDRTYAYYYFRQPTTEPTKA